MTKRRVKITYNSTVIPFRFVKLVFSVSEYVHFSKHKQDSVYLHPVHFLTWALSGCVVAQVRMPCCHHTCCGNCTVRSHFSVVISALPRHMASLHSVANRVEERLGFQVPNFD